MTPEQLKASLIQYAMQGKLTEQNEEDGSAADLLALLHIDSKVEANEPPYDIPDNWLWIPIGNLGESTDTDSFSDGPFGSNLKTVHYIDKPEVRIIQLSNIGEDGWKDKNVKYTSFKHLEEVIPRCEVHPGDFVIAKMMPAGRTIEVPDLGTRITLGSDAMKFVPNKCLDKRYLLWAMHSQAFLEQVYAEAHGITRVRTTLNGVKSYVLPIPPLEEQHRIVAKIEELLPYVDRYAEAYEKLEQFNAKFPEDMKKSILQYAIQGKLVEQRPEEGTAEELYHQIQDEKQKLIKEGKIKKEKPLPEITEDEIPFDIPESWKWDRLGNLLIIERGGSPRPIKDFITTDDNGINWIKIGDTEKGSKYINSCAEKIKPDGMKKSRYVEKGDFILSNSMSFGRPYILNIDGCIHDGWLVLRQPVQVFDNDYLYYLLSSPMVFYQFCGRVAGAVVNNLNSDKVALTVVPIPPIDEQKRIAKKIEEMLPYVDQLIKA